MIVVSCILYGCGDFACKHSKARLPGQGKAGRFAQRGRARSEGTSTRQGGTNVGARTARSGLAALCAAARGVPDSPAGQEDSCSSSVARRASALSAVTTSEPESMVGSTSSPSSVCTMASTDR